MKSASTTTNGHPSGAASKPTWDREFERHVYAVQRYVALTNSRYAPILVSGLVTHPICCFGNLRQAKVITVGVNPSLGEFAAIRQWPTTITHTDLARRCTDYFGGRSPHDWFEPWMESLGSLGVSYADGSAAHVDLSPRVTKYISELTEAYEKELFLDMVERDLWTFFGTLAFCRKVKRILMAGSVTGKYYINEFIQRFGPEYGLSLDGAFDRLAQRGGGKTAFHTLSGGRFQMEVFFCSTSPSARDRTILPRMVKAHADRLKP